MRFFLLLINIILFNITFSSSKTKKISKREEHSSLQNNKSPKISALRSGIDSASLKITFEINSNKGTKEILSKNNLKDSSIYSNFLSIFSSLPSGELKKENISEFLFTGMEKIRVEAISNSVYSKKINDSIIETFLMGCLKRKSVLTNINKVLKIAIMYQLIGKKFSNSFLRLFVINLIQAIGKILLLSIDLDVVKTINHGIKGEHITFSGERLIKRLLKLEDNKEIQNFFYLVYNLLTINQLKEKYKKEHKELIAIEKNLSRHAEILIEQRTSKDISNIMKIIKNVGAYEKELAKKIKILKNKSTKTYFDELIKGPKENNFLLNFIKDIIEDCINNHFENKKFNSITENIINISLKFFKHVMQDLIDHPNDYIENILLKIFTEKEFLRENSLLVTMLAKKIEIDPEFLFNENKHINANFLNSEAFQENKEIIKLISQCLLTRNKFSLNKEKEKNPQRKILSQYNKGKKNKIYINENFYLAFDDFILFICNKGLDLTIDKNFNTNKKIIKKLITHFVNQTHEEIKNSCKIEDIITIENAIEKNCIKENDGFINYEKTKEELAKLKTQKRDSPLLASTALVQLYTLLAMQLSEKVGAGFGDFIEQTSIFSTTKNIEKENELLFLQLSKINIEEQIIEEEKNLGIIQELHEIEED